jgi:hypothetical protein
VSGQVPDDAPGYTYDVFLSYCRQGGTVPEWMRNHFHPTLSQCLFNELGREPRVFLDTQMIEEGDHWPSQLIEAHRRSRVLVAVWAPPYFQSRWCLAEWRTMLERQRLLGRPGLIYPVVVHDGERFPPEARSTQGRDMKKWLVPFQVFDQTPEYIEFHRQVAATAKDLYARLCRVPEWQPDWPVLTPEPPPDGGPTDVPRLWEP